MQLAPSFSVYLFVVKEMRRRMETFSSKKTCNNAACFQGQEKWHASPLVFQIVACLILLLEILRMIESKMLGDEFRDARN